MRLLAPALMFALSCFASDDLAPQIETVSPKVVKPGDTVIVTGVSLGENHVEELYLSDHKFDMKVKVLAQNAETIKFRVPPFSKPGRMQLVILAKPQNADDDPKLLEIPAYLLIEDISTTEITRAQPVLEKGKKAAEQPKDQQKDQQRDPR